MLNHIRWYHLINKLGKSIADENHFLDIESSYAQPHRHYHTGRHIEHCLREFDTARHLTMYPEAVEFAIWLHDVVYNPLANDNEEQSADWATRILKAIGCEEPVMRRVKDLIMATKYHTSTTDRDTQLLLDIDLSILGQPADDYDVYEKAIRAEYRQIPRDAYRTGRREVLGAFSEKSRIFQTELFFEQYEISAKQNIERALCSL